MIPHRWCSLYAFAPDAGIARPERYRSLTEAAEALTAGEPDAHAFAGHIACNAASRSELVVQILRDGIVVAVIDLDSPEPARFDEEDAAGIEMLGRAIASAI